jgi:hypothetical protein
MPSYPTKHYLSPQFHHQEYALPFCIVCCLCNLHLLITYSYQQEIDPCKSISDEDIRTTIQNSGGPKGAMFLPEVCV